MPELSDCISPAPLAVPHLFDIFRTFILHFPLHLLRGRVISANLYCAMRGMTLNVYTPISPTFFAIAGDMVFVDTRNIDRVDLHDHVPFHCLFDPFQLLGEEQFCAFESRYTACPCSPQTGRSLPRSPGRWRSGSR